MLPTELMEKVKRSLSKKRYLHSVGVALTATSMAMAFGLDTEKAFVAGLLHDCAKEFSEEKTLNFCKKHDIVLSAEEKNCMRVVHGKTGAVYAAEKYGISDSEILSAIRYHVGGKPAMSTLEAIIYVADYIEPFRKMNPEGYDEIRRLSFSNLELAVYKISEGICKHLEESSSSVVSDVFDTRDYYRKLCGMEE